jgi:hypothetical protein
MEKGGQGMARKNGVQGNATLRLVDIDDVWREYKTTRDEHLRNRLIEDICRL